MNGWRLIIGQQDSKSFRSAIEININQSSWINIAPMYITGENVILKGFWFFYETVIPVIRRNIYWNRYRFPERGGLSAFQPYSGLSLVDYLDISLGTGWAALINSVTSNIWSSKKTCIGKYLIWITVSTSPVLGAGRNNKGIFFVLI